MAQKYKSKCEISWGGTKRWIRHGNLHREDGPAIEQVNGHKEYWRYGKRHRLDGPAVEPVIGTRSGPARWFVNNIEYPEILNYWMAVAEWKKQHG